MRLRIERIIGMALPSVVGLLYASTARAVDLSNVDFVRAEFGYTHILGDSNRALGTRVPYGGGLGGFRVAASKRFKPWVGYEFDFHLLAGGINEPQADVGLAFSTVFAPLQWKGSSSGSLVFGIGLGGGVGRPLWLPWEPSANALAFTRLMVLPTAKTRLQIEYRITPISTYPLSAGQWVVAHDADISFGKGTVHFGVRGRIESVSPMPSLVPGSSGTYLSWWFGPFVAATGN